MKPCGFIATYMFRDLNTWRGWKELPLNIPLLIYQLTFMIIGTAYGKIKWPKYYDLRGLIPMWSLAILSWFVPKWAQISMLVIMVFIAMAMLRCIDWRKVWRAAQVSHVRLVLESITTAEGISERFFRTISFGWPKAIIEIWDTEWNKGKHRYFDPTFEPSPEFIERMIGYAEKLVKNPVARKYDWLQLSLGYVVNFIIWLPCPWLWGKEVVPWFNLPGGLEVCISGLVAVLRWGENAPRRALTIFFKIYHIPVIPPCLAAISENWREVKQ